ncbi:MAG TPA: YdcH family protein [Polyangiaceae bacterium]|nr:YdcH family protein [Polyangiaceae bacterium]
MKLGIDMPITDLEARHRDLDLAVSRLGRRAYLTPLEQRTVADLKKERLWTKDRIAVLRKSEPPSSR